MSHRVQVDHVCDQLRLGRRCELAVTTPGLVDTTLDASEGLYAELRTF